MSSIPPVPLAVDDGPLTWMPWVDSIVETVGHDTRSAYVERFWLASIGPAALLLLRRLADEFDAQPDGFRAPVSDLSSVLGLRYRSPSQSVLCHALERMCLLGLARTEGTDRVLVRRRLTNVTARQLQRLPAHLRNDHERWVSVNPRRPAHEVQRLRARHLALSLLDLGDTIDLAERQLHLWGFHPALAHDAVGWAGAERRGNPRSGPSATSGAAARAMVDRPRLSLVGAGVDQAVVDGP